MRMLTRLRKSLTLTNAPYCITLQHTATHCNTLQHTATHTATHQTLEEFSNHERKQFLGFVWGRERLPRDTSGLQLEVRTQATHGDDHLPSSHTCFNALDIPRYSSLKVLRVLQCAAVCRSVLQCAAMCCRVLQGVAGCGSALISCSILHARCFVCCSVLQCVAV